MVKRLMTYNSDKPNKKEQKLLELIDNLKMPYKFVGNGEVIIEGLIPDFINNNGEKKIIEFYGSYWHGPEKKGISREE